MDDNIWEKDVLLPNTRTQVSFDDINHRRRSSSKRSVIAIISVLLVSNILSFLAGCSLAWVPRLLPTYSSDSGKHETFYRDIDQDTVHETTWAPFSYHLNNYTAPAGGDIDVDEAWRALGTDYEAFLIPVSHAEEFDLGPNHVLYTPETPSDTPGLITSAGYPAVIQSLHQLHCLNLIRKSLWYNADFYRAQGQGSWSTDQGEATFRAHTGHCLDAIRQAIMCTADTDVVPFYWMTRQGRTIPDFARRKQCRNFESVRQWGEKHQVKGLEDATFETPPDVELADVVGG